MRLFKHFLLICFLFCLSAGLSALWVGNEGLPPIGGGETDSQIVSGASAFLQAYSQYIMLLNESEKGSIFNFNYTNAQQIIGVCKANLVISREKFNQVVYLVGEIKFEQDALNKMIEFDYDDLARRRNLHIDVLHKVSDFLSKGDIKGLYAQMVLYLDAMIEASSSLESAVKSSMNLDLESLRALYQKFSDFMLFGYYSSLVFYEVRNSGV